MISSVIAAVSASVVALAVTFCYLRHDLSEEAYWGGLAASQVILVIDEILQRLWAALCVNGAVTVILVWAALHFWRKRRRKGRLAAMGAKSRARISSMIAKLRELAQPRPALRPVPENG
jgi:hypothetical protein